MKIILGSQSPRRHELLSSLGFEFEVAIPDIDEIYPPETTTDSVAAYIAKKKADALINKINEDDLLICADTVVVLEGKIIGKPSNRDHAKEMLERLSGRTHKVITSYCIVHKAQYHCNSVETLVTFNELEEEEINYYLENGNPYDKAGGYGIQDWIGCIAVHKIVGSYTNVMGFPTAEIFNELKKLGV